MQLGCCANTRFGGFSGYASACGISSERCPLPTATTGGNGGNGANGANGGTVALHSIAGILTALVFAGLTLMLK